MITLTTEQIQRRGEAMGYRQAVLDIADILDDELFDIENDVDESDQVFAMLRYGRMKTLNRLARRIREIKDKLPPLEVSL